MKTKDIIDEAMSLPLEERALVRFLQSLQVLPPGSPPAIVRPSFRFR